MSCEQLNWQRICVFVELQNNPLIDTEYKGETRVSSIPRALPSVKLERPHRRRVQREKEGWGSEVGRRERESTEFQIFKATAENFQVARFDESFLVKGFRSVPPRLRSAKTLTFTDHYWDEGVGRRAEGNRKRATMFRVKNLSVDSFRHFNIRS